MLSIAVQIKRKKPKSQALPMIRPSLPTLHSKDVSLKPNIFQPGRSPSFPPYPGLSTCQPYSYFNNTMAGKNISMPYVTPFAVNHGPTFINLGSHSTVYNKSQSSAPFTLKKVVEDGFSDNNDSCKCPNESELNHNLEQEVTGLDSKKLGVSPNSYQQPSFMSAHGSYQKYRSSCFESNIFSTPPRKYPNLSDGMSYNNAFFSKSFQPCSPYPSTQFSPSIYSSGIQNPNDFIPQFPRKEEDHLGSSTTPTTRGENAMLESLSVIASQLPKRT